MPLTFLFRCLRGGALGTALGLKRNGGIVCTQSAWSRIYRSKFFRPDFRCTHSRKLQHVEALL